MVRDKVLRWCRTQRLFSSGETVTAALSGGADSVAMLHLLLSLQGELGITLRAAHYHHHLRGAESDRDQAFCERLCAQWGIELLCGGGDVRAYAARHSLGLETAARKLRYEFFAACGGKIATAHTADDNLETVLLHLVRGAALRGLGGIPPARGVLVRPVLCLTRAEIEAYLAENGLSHITDSTNEADGCPRNRIRHHVVPLLRRENPQLAESVLAAAQSLRADEAFLAGETAALLASAAAPGGWDAAALAAAPRPLRLRALRQILESSGEPHPTQLTASHLALAERLLTAGPSARIDLPGLTLRREYGLLLCGPAAEPSFAPFRLPLPGTHSLPDGRVLRCEGPFPYGGEPGLCLALPAPPWVRPRRVGDRLRQGSGEKTLKRLMIDRKIPAARRGGVPVLELDGTVVAAWGVGSDPRFRPAPGQPCYRVQIEEEREKGEESTK